MRRALLLLVATLAARAAQAGDAPSPERAFVEVSAPRATCYVHEAVRLRLRFGYDRDFFRDHGVPLFHQRTDVPLQVLAPWFEDHPGTVALAELPAEAAGERRPQSVVLDDGLAQATPLDDQVRDGRVFAVLEIERRLAPARAGALVVPAPALRFAHAERFQEDFVSGRTPVDSSEERVAGSPFTLEVLPLPSEGRPAEFVDAVGRFRLHAQADRSEVATGETLRVTLVIEGRGNLERLTPPRLDGLADFHLYGTTDDRGPARRTVVYDLAPLRLGVTQVPAIPFAFFDPSPPAGYRLVRSDPLPLRLRPREGASPATPPPAGAAATTTGTSGPDPTRVLLLLAALLVLGAGALWARRRARRAKAVSPEVARRRRAAEALRAAVARPGADLADAFAECLAAHLDCPAAAVIAPDLSARLVKAGLPEDLASRAATTLEGLVAVRYGGGAPAGDPPAVAALALALEEAFRRGAAPGARPVPHGGTPGAAPPPPQDSSSA